MERTTSAPRLLDQVRDIIRLKHYSIRTEHCYIGWIRRFILFHDKRHPRDMGAPEITGFLTHLAVKGNVAAATQNQALNAILFLYRNGDYRCQASHSNRCSDARPRTRTRLFGRYFTGRER
jgi:Phage integrase, N-terminal SAM-like domain